MWGQSPLSGFSELGGGSMKGHIIISCRRSFVLQGASLVLWKHLWLVSSPFELMSDEEFLLLTGLCTTNAKDPNVQNVSARCNIWSVKTYTVFMELHPSWDCSSRSDPVCNRISCSQEPTIGFYSESLESIPYPHTISFFLFGIVGVAVQLGPLGTAVTNRPIVPAPDNYDDGEIGGMIGRGNLSTRRKTAPVPLCSP
jgi:hypothetical protein